MQLTGKQIIGSQFIACEGEDFQARNPATGELLAPVFREADTQAIERAATLADHDFDVYRTSDNRARSLFLEAIAEQLMALARRLVDRAHLETGLPVVRLEGELARTVGQIRMFARLVAEGSWADARIDHALPDRQPNPRPDIRSRKIPLGPVAVFGASNFPLAFSVAGGDTISALAAGCCVIAKGHPAHPGTSELAGQAILAAIAACGLPKGVFSLLQGRSVAVGRRLVEHPRIKAAAFTGSLRGGRTLFDLAAARPEPIPVFAEMGSINPVFLLPGALAVTAAEIAANFVAALTLGVGQFCTNPGLVVALQGAGLDTFMANARKAVAEKTPGTMLSREIKLNYLQRITALNLLPGVEQVIPAGAGDASGCSVVPALYKIAAETWLENPALAEEVFGPAALVVECATAAQMMAVAGGLQGQLTATIHACGDETEECADLVRVLERKAGRLIWNGFPTGVEVCDAMFHGGPYPAATDSRASSVGSSAMQRFLRPVCYQNFPESMLPADLSDSELSGCWRLVDGKMSKAGG